MRLSDRNGPQMDSSFKLTQFLQLLQNEVCCHHWCFSDDSWYIFSYLGIFLKCLNTLYWRNYVDMLFEWLPQQIFFFCTFGYMCILIIAKWSIAWEFERDTAVAPSIIGQMIALPLQMGST